VLIPHFLQENTGTRFLISHYRFLPFPLQFIILSSYYCVVCSLLRATDSVVKNKTMPLLWL
jgi:hypothetical protein